MCTWNKWTRLLVLCFTHHGIRIRLIKQTFHQFKGLCLTPYVNYAILNCLCPNHNRRPMFVLKTQMVGKQTSKSFTFPSMWLAWYSQLCPWFWCCYCYWSVLIDTNQWWAVWYFSRHSQVSNICVWKCIFMHPVWKVNEASSLTL